MHIGSQIFGDNRFRRIFDGTSKMMYGTKNIVKAGMKLVNVCSPRQLRGKSQQAFQAWVQVLTSVVIKSTIHMKVPQEVERLRIGDIDTIKKSQEIHDTEEGNETPVNPRNYLPLRRVGRATNMEFIVFDFRSTGMVRIIPGDISDSIVLIARRLSYMAVSASTSMGIGIISM